MSIPEAGPRLCPAQSDIELVPKQQILGFQLPARLEQVAEEPYESSEKNRHLGNDATILPRKANPQPDGIFGKDS